MFALVLGFLWVSAAYWGVTCILTNSVVTRLFAIVMFATASFLAMYGSLVG